MWPCSIDVKAEKRSIRGEYERRHVVFQNPRGHIDSTTFRRVAAGLQFGGIQMFSG